MEYKVDDRILLDIKMLVQSTIKTTVLLHLLWFPILQKYFTVLLIFLFFSPEETHLLVQSTPDNSNLQGKLKKVRVIGISEQMTGNKEKTVFTLFLFIQYISIKFNHRIAEWKWNILYKSDRINVEWETKESKAKKQENSRYCELCRFQRELLLLQSSYDLLFREIVFMLWTTVLIVSSCHVLTNIIRVI